MTLGSLPSLSLNGLGRVGDLLGILQIDISDKPNYKKGEHIEEKVIADPYSLFGDDGNGNRVTPEVEKVSKRKRHPVQLLNHQIDETKIWTWSSPKMFSKVETLSERHVDTSSILPTMSETIRKKPAALRIMARTRRSQAIVIPGGPDVQEVKQNMSTLEKNMEAKNLGKKHCTNPPKTIPGEKSKKYLGGLKDDSTHVKKPEQTHAYKCFKCNKFFPHKYNLKQHMVTHFQHKFSKLPSTEPFICPSCGDEFTQKAPLVMHFAYVHEVSFRLNEDLLMSFFRRSLSTVLKNSSDLTYRKKNHRF